jgi:hypothetical protein
VVLSASQSQAQDDKQNSLAGNAAAESRAFQQLGQSYTIKSGDFRLLAVPSLSLAYNDNINTAPSSEALDDFILTPAVQLTASYPLTAKNVIRLNVGIGYDFYLMNSSYSGIRLTSGSELSLDAYAGDFWFNFHERFSFTQDSAGNPDLANTGQTGGPDNTVGLNTTWDLKDLVLTLGYDHHNFWSSSATYSYQDLATERVPMRAGFRVNPALDAGLDGSVAWTRYDQPVLNNNVGYNAGIYGDWRPGNYLSVLARFGYTIYNFDQTSQQSTSGPGSPPIKAVNQNAWYLDLTVTHNVSEAVSYSLSAGHELTLGTQADTTEDWYVRPNLTWRFIKDLPLNFGFFYENGTQGNGASYGNFVEAYEYMGGSIGTSYHIMKKLSLGLNYRFTYRTSDAQGRDYTQNVVTLTATYVPN